MSFVVGKKYYISDSQTHYWFDAVVLSVDSEFVKIRSSDYTNEMNIRISNIVRYYEITDISALQNDVKTLKERVEKLEKKLDE